MPSVMHEVAHRLLSRDIWAMGMPKDELISLNSGRIQGRNSLNEADEAYIHGPTYEGFKSWLAYDGVRIRSIRVAQSAEDWRRMVVDRIRRSRQDFASYLPQTSALSSNTHREMGTRSCSTANDLSCGKQRSPTAASPYLCTTNWHRSQHGHSRVPYSRFWKDFPPRSDACVVFTAQDLTEGANVLWAATQWEDGLSAAYNA